MPEEKRAGDSPHDARSARALIRRASAWSRATTARRRTRRFASIALAVVAALCLLLSILFGYASRVFFNSDQFANHVTAAVQKPAVRDELARRVTDQVVKGKPDLIGIRPIIESAAGTVIDNSSFQSLLRSGVEHAHEAIFDRDRDSLVLTIADIGTVLHSAVKAISPKAAKEIPGAKAARVLSSNPPQWMLDLARTGQGFRETTVSFFVFFLVAAGLGFLLALDRRRYVTVLGVSVAVAGGILVFGYQLGRSILLNKVGEPDTREAAAGVWDAFLLNLRTALLLAAGAGAIIAAASRSLAVPAGIEAPGVEAPIVRAWRRMTTVPERRWVRTVRALLLVIAGLVIVFERDAVIQLVVLAGGLYVLYKGVEELLRLIAERERPEPAVAEPAPARRRLLGRQLQVAGAATLLVILAGGLFFAFGGTSESSPAINECNGSAALCDQPFNEVALPATHNAMSGADVPDYLFANQEYGIPQQLDDGVRALLFDTHYGIPADNGRVRTDLEDPHNVERKQYVKDLSKPAVDAALQIRNRLVTGGTGEHHPYLCHRFCELGAVPLRDALDDIRSFLVKNPDVVLVIVNEDYVSPEDFVAQVEASGVSDFVYRGDLGPPWPTLREMIDQNQRVVVMAENEGGAAPWYHAGYADGIVQETPYHFTDPSELTDPKELPKTCKANRGSSDAPLFLINHWIDTSPAPRPSNAEQVNAYKPLLDRVRECERLRDLTANLIAVDFYATGDLFRVVDKLNRVPAGG